MRSSLLCTHELWFVDFIKLWRQTRVWKLLIKSRWASFAISLTPFAVFFSKGSVYGRLLLLSLPAQRKSVAFWTRSRKLLHGHRVHFVLDEPYSHAIPLVWRGLPILQIIHAQVDEMLVGKVGIVPGQCGNISTSIASGDHWNPSSDRMSMFVLSLWWVDLFEKTHVRRDLERCSSVHSLWEQLERVKPGEAVHVIIGVDTFPPGELRVSGIRFLKVPKLVVGKGLHWTIQTVISELESVDEL